MNSISRTNALIGCSGFIGTTLSKQFHFDTFYRSNNISDIIGKTFETVVCAAAPGTKWLANKYPDKDRSSINLLTASLSGVKTKKFILISTVDVFSNPHQVREQDKVKITNLHPYGRHRYQLEEFVKTNFSNYLIVRLPGVVGPGLKKNIIYDFHNQNNLNNIDSRSVFQFYPVVNLWKDLQVAIKHDCKLLHLTSAPISVGEIAKECFNLNFKNVLDNVPANYDFQTEFSDLFDSKIPYQYGKKEVILAINFYVQSESRKENF